ncbi:MAG: DNA repair protein RecO (recombination protein O) [Pelagibacterales bacterium]|nr:DNA repair protein RecO (recombination protein O) [Pelagibacterales bacterium]
MHWTDEGYLISKRNYDENSIIIEAFTLDHGKCAGIIYGGSSRKKKRFFQIGNKIFLNWKSKSENRIGYFDTELLEAISPLYFDDKKKTTCILSATSILKILLPERQVNKKIYLSFQKLMNFLKFDDWIKLYIYWELSLVKELGFDINIFNKNNSNLKSNSIVLNGKSFKIPLLFIDKKKLYFSKSDIKNALLFNRSILLENFINPNNLRIPYSRNMLERYYS